ncbi:sensor histidine kinase [Undibacterium sp. Ji83W]|uniref:sensor histidine kinase n=1 Tax=Undibacterium sp. Ji83W TaxID=3413043 RepID=UPI003BF01B5C
MPAPPPTPLPDLPNSSHRVWRNLRISIPAMLMAACYFSIMFRDPFFITLVYVACIGFLIQVLLGCGHYGMVRYLRKYRPEHTGAVYNWPGWAWMGPWIIISGVLGFYFGTLLANVLTGQHREPSEVLRNARTLTMVMSVVFVSTAGLVFLVYMRGRMALMEMRTQTALRAAAENQLKLLESQLEPHMLFNTLANLRVLIGLDPPRAQEMLDHLTDFLRATLEASRNNTHTLAAEFSRIEDYLTLMQIRMGSRLRQHLDLPPELGSLMVPPLLLQPLVENAIKHGLDPVLDGGRIQLTARCEADMLVLSVRDTGIGLGDMSRHDGHGIEDTKDTAGTHFGLQQVRERLLALYGKAGSLELSAADDAEGGSMAIVRLPLQLASKAKD